MKPELFWVYRRNGSLSINKTNVWVKIDGVAATASVHQHQGSPPDQTIKGKRRAEKNSDVYNINGSTITKLRDIAYG
jgi:hypothetical protein